MIRTAIDLVGSTPLIEVARFAAQCGSQATICAKLEQFNLTGSVKDRVAKALIADGESRGILSDGSIIIEASSGNTGIGLAAVGAAKGYPVWIVMPDSVSVERRAMMQAYGAKLFLTPGSRGMKGAIALAEQLEQDNPNAHILGQFTNPANPQVHYLTTGPEIWEQSEEEVDVLVAGIGTGGTISGAGRFLKEMKPSVTVVGVEPSKSAVISGGEHSPHAIQGIGAGFIPDTLDRSVLDQMIQIDDEDAVATARMFSASEGVFVGISAGAALAAARQISLDPAFAGKKIVVVLPDSGDRYLSTPLGTFPDIETSEI